MTCIWQHANFNNDATRIKMGDLCRQYTFQESVKDYRFSDYIYIGVHERSKEHFGICVSSNLHPSRVNQLICITWVDAVIIARLSVAV